jgi:hypothetical protein
VDGASKPAAATSAPEADDFADELIEKIEILTNEKSELVKSLEESKAAQQQLRKELEATVQTKAAEQTKAAVQTKAAGPEPDADLHKKCQTEKKQLLQKICELETSLKDMSDSHVDQVLIL